MLSANIGPRSDAYAPAARMTAEEAEAHHAEQIGWLADSAVDVVSGYTIAYHEEAIGIVRAARARDLPAVIAFTVETDGRLPVGTPLGETIETIEAVDEVTDGHAAHHMINCAHPDHFADVLAAARDAPWTARLGGVGRPTPRAAPMPNWTPPRPSTTATPKSSPASSQTSAAPTCSWPCSAAAAAPTCDTSGPLRRCLKRRGKPRPCELHPAPERPL